MEEIAQVFCNVTEELINSKVFIKLHQYLENQKNIPVDSIYLISKADNGVK